MSGRHALIAGSGSAGARDGRLGSWPCDNAARRVSAAHDGQAAVRGERFEHFFADLGPGGSLVHRQATRGSSEARQLSELGASQTAIAAISGLLPIIFMTRVRL